MVWSDYLCPWCHNAAVRLRGIQGEFGDRVSLRWQSFLLRPRPDPNRDLETFRRYTRSWRRPAEDEDAAEFNEWRGDEGPPSHSIPPHLVAKAAAQLGPDEFGRVHERLLRAYFVDSRDITSPNTLRSIWQDAGLDPSELARAEDPALLEQVLREHNDALEAGVTGVPAVKLDGQPFAITGAHPRDLYRRWIERALSQR